MYFSIMWGPLKGTAQLKAGEAALPVSSRCGVAFMTTRGPLDPPPPSLHRPANWSGAVTSSNCLRACAGVHRT
jgi:hypothetical protein